MFSFRYKGLYCNGLLNTAHLKFKFPKVRSVILRYDSKQFVNNFSLIILKFCDLFHKNDQNWVDFICDNVCDGPSFRAELDGASISHST